MTSLEQSLESAGIGKNEPFNKRFQSDFDTFIKNNHEFYQRACENKPEHSELQILLGLLTKLHIEATSGFESGLASSQAMKDLIEDSVGTEHSKKFKHNQTEVLLFATHLWLTVQGRLGMDFSLANDHAVITSELIAKAVVTDVDEQRTQFLEGYYQGLSIYKAQQTPVGLFAKIKKLFNFF
ncbi:hypothetical protein [Vibrio profundi]|uniref:hypothetical protein n=1 Tax=Vibrio profundi TaxID=1774960 RepID=UPI0037350F42